LDVDINEPGFYAELDSRIKNPMLPMLNMVSNIVYNFAVSKELFEKEISLSEYKAELLKWYNEGSEPKVSKSSKQLVYSNDHDTPIKKAIAATRDAVHNILSGNMIKDSSNKAMSLVGLS
jgi:hypothetical protein